MSAHKDRLIAAADLLGMDPDDLLSRLDARTLLTEPDDLLTAARQCAAEGLEGHALRRYRKLDDLLTAGGRLPAAWAPAADESRGPGEHTADCTRAGVYGHPGECAR